jgi:hypothetical protein
MHEIDSKQTSLDVAINTRVEWTKLIKSSLHTCLPRIFKISTENSLGLLTQLSKV